MDGHVAMTPHTRHAAPPRGATGGLRGSDIGLYVHASIAILLTEGFYLQLSGTDPSSLASQGGGGLAGLAIYAIGLAYGAGVALLVAGRGLRLRPILPLSLFLLWAGLSALWSIEAYTSVRITFQLASSFLFAVYISFTRSSNEIARLVFIALVSIVLLSLVWVFVFPTFAVHGSIDLFQSVHAGKWRGIYPHKNSLGEVALLATAVAVLLGPSFVQSRIAALALMAAAATCLLFSSSKTGIVGSVILVPATVLYLFAIRRLRTPLSLTILNLLIVFVVAMTLYLSTATLSDAALDELLTGRYLFWKFLASRLDAGLVLGHGYMAGYPYDILPYVAVLFPSFLPYEPHNGYLDVFIGLGAVGLGLLALAVAAALGSAWRLIRSEEAQARRLGAAAVIIIAVTLFSSLTESALMRPGPLTVFFMLALTAPAVRAQAVFRRRPEPRLGVTSVAA